MSDVANVAPEPDEIEITPEMIEAGARELTLSFSLDGHLDDSREVVADVFRAMTRAAHREPANS